uniref:Uncharacterized protein n=1 Tax=Avena sativa TaxID=4498 RepID=A0ACD5YYU5_AVESA
MQSYAITTFSLGPGARGNMSFRLAARPGERRPSLPGCWQRRHGAALLQRRRVSAETQQHEADDRLNRNPCDFYASVWGDFFLHHCSGSAASSQEQRTWMEGRVDDLKKEVAKLIAISATCSLLERLNLIYQLERLCLDYLFETEIDVALTEIHNANINGYDLHTVALWFYLLRKHGYKVSPDVFEKFLDKDGTFQAKTPRELLSLYNAAHFGTNGEIILDKAIHFTKRSLESKLPYLVGSLTHEIQCALEIPLPRRVAIYEAQVYISTYEEDATMNKMVLELAKLNFNLMQLQYQQELETATRWWTDLQIHSRLPFARDRLVECYLWMLGVYYEPTCSRGRIILTFVINIATILDDIYDSFGTLEECELFTQWIESWDPNAPHDLPECMQYAARKLMESYQIIDNELPPKEKYRMTYLRNFVSDIYHLYVMYFPSLKILLENNINTFDDICLLTQ